MPPAFQFRRAVAADAEACVALRARTRENAISAARLAGLGITAESWAEATRSGRLVGHLVEAPAGLAGYAFGDVSTGEVVVLALLPAWEGQGLGRELLARVVRQLFAAGHQRLFLGCARDPALRSSGFYRHLGWRPTGQTDGQGDEILQLLAEATAATSSGQTR